MPQSPNGAAPFAAAERKVLAKLTSPEQIQRFLDRELTYNLEPQGETCRSPRLVLRDGVAHCMEGALMAAAALRCLGHPPLLVDLEAVRDHDHVLAVSRRNGRWGALARSEEHSSEPQSHPSRMPSSDVCSSDLARERV